MDVRETLNTPRGKIVAIGVVVLSIVLLLMSFQLGSGSATNDGSSTAKAYFTDDDGATTFVDDVAKSTPFDHNGKQAVRAYVFSDGKGKFVAYLERVTPEGKAQAEKLKADPRMSGDPIALKQLAMTGVEVKKPNQKDWVPKNSAAGQDITIVKSRTGKEDDLQVVTP